MVVFSKRFECFWLHCTEKHVCHNENVKMTRRQWCRVAVRIEYKAEE